MLRYYQLCLLCLLPVCGLTQDLQQSLKKIKDRWQDQPVNWHGHFSVQGITNRIEGADRRVDPFSLRIQAGLVLDVLGIKAPFQFNYSDGNTLYRLPSFLISGISPHYKNFTLHAGDRSMYFSDYSLAGHGFRGIGLEYNSQKSGWYSAAFYGRLRRAFASDLESKQAIEPTQKRMGFGVKTGYRRRGDEITVSIIKIWDSDQPLDMNQVPELKPAENVVLSLQIKKQLGIKWNLEGELAQSLLNQDKNASLWSGSGWNQTYGLIQPTITYQKNLAYKGGFTYRITPRHDIRFFLEHIDPGYRSLGALFFQNDFERIALQSHHQFLKNKLQLQIDLGSERNNLKQFEGNQLRRLRGSMHIQWLATPEWQWVGHFSNIRQTNKLYAFNNPALPVDSLVLAITNNQAQLQSLYNNKDRSRSFQFLLQYQELQQIRDEQITDQSSANWLSSFQYNWRLCNDRAWIAALFTLNTNASENLQLHSWSPGMTWNHQVHPDWNYTLSVIPSLIIQNQQHAAIWSARAQLRHRISPAQQLQLAFQYLNRSGSVASRFPDFVESNLRLQYQYHF